MEGAAFFILVLSTVSTESLSLVCYVLVSWQTCWEYNEVCA